MKRIGNTDELSRIVRFPLGQIADIISRKNEYYYSFKRLKESGKTRELTPSRSQLKDIQIALNHFLSRSGFPHYVHGYVKHRDALTNAMVHVRKKWVVNIDIKDFFPSCHTDKVSKAFNLVTTDTETREMLTELVCYNNQLPQGTSTSPIVSNLVLVELDRDFHYLAKKYQFKYTRYADDITLSTDSGECPKTFQQAFKDIIKRHGFEMNENKLKFVPASQRQVVTGFVVNSFNKCERLSPTKDYLRDLKELIRECYHEKRIAEVACEMGKTVLELKRSINGRIRYIERANPKKGQELKDMLFPLKPRETCQNLKIEAIPGVLVFGRMYPCRTI